ncbi:MAG: class I SAM-dependent methyltransferase [Solirubrobacterales bacterium]
MNEHFDAIAGQYDRSLPPHVVEHYLQKRLDYIREHAPAGASVLDVGCGTGLLADRVQRAGFSVTGVDPSEGMLEFLRKRNPRVATEVASGTDLPFPDSSFDLVYCVAVMHHIADRGEVEKALGEMVRVTAAGGRVLVWDHNPRNPYWRLLMARVPQDTGEERLIPEREILAGLRRAGATPLDSAQLGLVPDFTPRAMVGVAARLERGAERVPGLRRLCAHNVILAAKPPPGSPPPG